MPAVYELEQLQCKFCPGGLKPDVSRKQKAPGFRFYRCEKMRPAQHFRRAEPDGRAGLD
jgi:hypothetical protein